MDFFSKRLTNIWIFFQKRGLLFFGIFILCFSSFGLFTSQTSPHHSIEQLLLEGRRQWIGGQKDSSYSTFRKVQSLTKDGKDIRLWAYATQKSGEYLVNHMRFEEAIPTLDSVIAVTDSLEPMDQAIFFARKAKAYLELMRNDYPKALVLYQELKDDAERLLPANDSLLANAYQFLGQAQYYNGQYKNSLESMEKAISIYNEVFEPDNMAIGICRNSLAISHMYLENQEDALSNFIKSSEILAKNLGPSHPKVIEILTNIGVQYSSMGLYWKSLEYHRKNLPYLDKLNHSAHLNGLINLGIILSAVGDHDESLEIMNQADAFMLKYPNMTPVAKSYIDLYRSLSYEALGDIELAVEYLDASHKNNQKILGNSHPDLIYGYHQMGSLKVKLGKYDEAIDAYQKMSTIAQKHIGPQSESVGNALYEISNVYAEQENWDKALRLNREATEIFAQGFNVQSKTIAYIARAEIWRAQGIQDSIFPMHTLAWEALMPDLPFQLHPDTSVLRHWTSSNLVSLLTQQGNSLKWRFEQTQQISDLEAALASYQCALAAVDSQRHYFEAPGSKQLLISQHLPLYESATAQAIRLHELTEEQQYLAIAFQLSEKSKSRNLNDHLRGVQALTFAGIPDSLIEREQYFRQRLVSLQESKARIEDDDPEKTKLQEESFTLRQSYRAFLDQLEQEYPRYFHLKYSNNTFALGKIQEQVLPNQALYSYFWGPTTLFIFKSSEGKSSAYSLNLVDQVNEPLAEWLGFVSTPPSGDPPFEVGMQLAQLLFPNLDASIQQLIVVPDGQLGYLPFESLLESKPVSQNFRTWPFLAKTRTFNYVYSIELWLKSLGLSSPSIASNYVGFAPDFSGAIADNTRSDLGPLKYNQREVQQAAQLLSGQALTGTNAKESILKNLETNPTILHFATHAIAEESSLMQSRIFFTSESDSLEDGILHASEVYGLSLSSPLAILSACQTGRGPLVKGEGIMSLARAFQYSGCSRVLTTLWKTDDQAGASLSSYFFKELVKEIPIEKALQNSRLQWLEESPSYLCHPYYWSGFVLIGSGGIVFQNSSGLLSNLFLGLLVIVGLVAGIIIFKRKIKS